MENCWTIPLGKIKNRNFSDPYPNRSDPLLDSFKTKFLRIQQNLEKFA